MRRTTSQDRAAMHEILYGARLTIPTCACAWARIWASSGSYNLGVATGRMVGPKTAYQL